MHFIQFKRSYALFIISLLFNFLFLPESYAQGQAGLAGVTGLLQQIANYTRNILANLNSAPGYIQDISQKLGVLVNAWVPPDDSETTANIQTNFAQFGKSLVDQVKEQNELQYKVNFDLLNNSINSVLNSSFNTQLKSDQPIISPNALEPLPFANDLVYSTLFNQPFAKKDPRKPEGLDIRYNYIKNASGLNIYHQMPETTWQGSQEAQTRYRNYYNTAMAVESFNAFVLSQQYVDKGQFTEQQNKLIDQATNSTTWFQQVATENIGFVLRQLLIYESQVFVLMTESLKTQRQMLTAQTMTNALLIVVNQLNEANILSTAKTAGGAPTA